MQARKEEDNSKCQEEPLMVVELEEFWFWVEPWLLQLSPASVNLNSCCKSNGTSEMGSPHISSNEFISSQNSILEEISVLGINGGKEALKNGDDESLLYDITKEKTDNISQCGYCGIDNEEYTLPVLKISSEPPLLEAIEEVKKEEGASETVLVEHVEEILPIKSVEEEAEDDDEYEEEKGEQSSEETGDSSMESIAEAIWAAESNEKLTMELKEMKFTYQNSGEKIGEEDGTLKIDSSNEYGSEDDSTRKSMVISDNKDTIKLLTVNDPVRLRMLILGTVLLLLMLVFLTHQEALFSYLVNGDSVL